MLATDALFLGIQEQNNLIDVLQWISGHAVSKWILLQFQMLQIQEKNENGAVPVPALKSHFVTFQVFC